MNFSFTADGGGGVQGAPTHVNEDTKQQQNDSFSKSPIMVSDFDDELICAQAAP